MPCRCAGVRYDKCQCRVVGSCYQGTSDRLVLVARESEYCAPAARPGKRTFLLRLCEGLYERCAGYNLRYCPFQGYVGTKNCINEALRDLLVLLCFLVANFVVLLTILARMTLHVAFAIVASGRWIKSSLLHKVASEKELMVLSRLRSQQAHNFSAPQNVY